MHTGHFTSPLAYHVWDTRYRWRVGDQVHDLTIEDTWQRIAHALAAAEPAQRDLWAKRFYAILGGFRYLPGGRIQAGAGTGADVTLFNCFVMGPIDDSPGVRYAALQESALTMRRGGGIGCDFSGLHPAGAALADGGVAEGPVASMRVWDEMCATLQGTGARRGAMMATLACDHPDIEQFIAAKAEAGALRHFNLSVRVSDAFMQALATDAEWPLAFPCATGHGGVARSSDSGRDANAGAHRVYRHVRAQQLWDRLMRANYEYAEPGVVFIDRIDAQNNLRYCEAIHGVNPCGEVPLPAYGACDLGSLNLPCFVSPFTQQAQLDWNALRDAAVLAVRMQDNVYDISAFPLPQQRDVARQSRRIGLGITGLADALIMLGITYGDAPSLRLAGDIMQAICHSAYRASIDLAKERGAFPAFDATRYLQSEFVGTLPKDIRAGIARHGIRNSHLTAIAPAGSISLLANNVSSGLEPAFGVEWRRLVRAGDAAPRFETAVDYAVHVFRAMTGETAHVPPAFITGAAVPPEQQLALQAALQQHVDNAISKTIAVPVQFEFERFRKVFAAAHELGLKGATTYRPNPVTGVVLVADDDGATCCRMTGSGVPAANG
jgi:ribonucleoside-diphosphate reductase alpha chain